MEHLTEEQLEAWGEQRLAPDVWWAVLEHVAICPACQDKLQAHPAMKRYISEATRRLRSEFESKDQHLEGDDLLARVEGKETPAAAAYALIHLAYCSGCRSDFEKIRQFVQEMKAQMEPQLEH
jgi:anti-sigma factor ChrR (cupin superfamily)